MRFPEDVLRAVMAHCEAAYPSEGCGVIVRARSGQLEVRPMTNALDRLHAEDPERFPRSARTGYAFDPREQLRIFSGPEPVVCVFHSHVHAEARFSEEDRRQAVLDGSPVLPGVSYLVLSVCPKVSDARLYLWKGTDFAGTSVPLPASHQPRATSHRS